MAKFFVELAKLILLPIIKVKLGKETPEMTSARERLIESKNNLDKSLKDLCARDPENFRCKEYFERYPEQRPKPYVMNDAADYIANKSNQNLSQISIMDVLLVMNQVNRIIELDGSRQSIERAASLLNSMQEKYGHEAFKEIHSLNSEYKNQLRGTQFGM